MAHIVVMPALGNTVESCLLSGWQVAVGEVVDVNSTLCEIETDKSTMDVPAGVSGTVLALLGEVGDDIPVKTPIAVVGEPGEDVAALLASTPGAPDAPAPASEPASAPPAPVSPEQASAPDAPTPTLPAATAASPAVGVSPRARARADAEGLPLASVTAGTGPGGRVIERDVVAALASGRRTHGARGADVTGIPGTGLGGRVTRDDLAAPAASSPPDVPAPAPAGEFPGAFSDTPLKGIRKLIADRMLHALAVSAQLTYTATADASAMLALRRRFKESDPALGFSAITLGDLVCFATVRVLQRHASLNAHLLDGTLRTFSGVHLGLAVDTPRGLLVPTIRHADALSLRELSAVTKDLAEQARSGRIDPDLLTGATFTVSNLGSFGIESFTPIINVPQTGILGVNTISPRAHVAADGSVGVQQRIGFSLTADHQVVDGADAGRFLADLGRAIEAIDLTVMG